MQMSDARGHPKQEVFLNRSLIVLLLASAVTCFVTNCASGPRYFIKYELDPSTPAPMTKEDVTIDLKYVDWTRLGDDSDFNPLGTPSSALDPQLWSTWDLSGQVYKGLVWFNPSFWKYTAFWVKVTNNTSHILRMGDARIFAVVGEDNYPAMTAQDILANMATADAKWRDVASKTVAGPRCKLMNDLGTEVMPHQSTKGFILFNVDPAKATTGTVSFYDVTTKVDDAGKPTEKAQYDFKIIQKMEQIK